MTTKKTFFRTILMVLAYVDILIMVYSRLHAQPVDNLSHFTISDIGGPEAGIPGEINVGESIENVIITARDINGERLTTYNGLVHLTEQTEAGPGRLEPASVQIVNGEWQGSIILYRAGKRSQDFGVTGDVWLEVTDNIENPHFGTSNLFTARPAEFATLLSILPGEEHFPGSPTGRTGDSYFQQAGTEFKVKVVATDAYWNEVKRIEDTIRIASSDSEAILSPNKTMLKSEVHMPVTLNTTGQQTVTVFDVTRPQIASHNSTEITVVVDIPDSVTHFVFDEISGPIVAGDTIQVTARALDENDLLVTSYNQQGVLSSSTGPGTLSIATVIFSNGVWSGQVSITRADAAARLTVTDAGGTASGESNSFEISAGTVSRLLVFLPGEVPSPGVQPGKSGQPDLRFVDELFDVEVHAVDRWWNLTQPVSLSLSFSAGDPEATLPGNVTQTTSSASYSVAFRKEGHNQLSVSVSNNPALSSYMSTLFFVDAGLIDRFVLSQIDSVQTAGEPFFVRIEAHNNDGDLVANYDSEILLAASTGTGTISTAGVMLSNGVWQGELHVTKADSDVVLFAADLVTPPNTHSGTSNAFSVQPNVPDALQLLLPGQTSTPGVTPGVQGVPSTLIAGDSAGVVVRLIDPFWNTIPTGETMLAVSTSDSFAVLPDTVALNNGAATFAVMFRSAGSHQVEVAPFFEPGLMTQTSDVTQVVPAGFARLVTLLPGEQLLAGDSEQDPNKGPGKTGARVIQTIGVPFQVQVLATDDFFNLVPAAAPDVITLFVTDTEAVISPPDTVLVGGAAGFTVTLMQGGNQVMRAADLSDNGIRQSNDNVVQVLSGGLHYDLSVSVDSVIAGDSFEIDVSYRDGVGEVVSTANHAVRVTLVASSETDVEIGEVSVPTFNLESGRKNLSEFIVLAGAFRLRFDDDLGTPAKFSDPVVVSPGPVASVTMSVADAEIGAVDETVLTAQLLDRVDNVVPAETVFFEVLFGNGTLSANSTVSNVNGVASVTFRGGGLTETNTIQARAGEASGTIPVVVNLTMSDLSNGEVVNYPNPFGMATASTRIDYYLEADGDVDLRIFDLFGNLVWSRTIAAGLPGARGRTGNAHPNSVEWFGVNDRGQEVGNGGYILLARAVANGKEIMRKKRKIVVLR